MTRDDHVVDFFRCSQEAFLDTAPHSDALQAVSETIFVALTAPARVARAPTPARLSACEHLPRALAVAEQGPPRIAALARAFATLAPHLAWQRRASAVPGDGAFFDGHANALVAGPGGLEERSDVMVGVSLVAPGVRYPDHRHPPEEIYVVLSGGEWRQHEGPWHLRGPGDVVHNPPGIVHAMRAGDEPLLALWLLWLGTG